MGSLIHRTSHLREQGQGRLQGRDRRMGVQAHLQGRPQEEEDPDRRRTFRGTHRRHEDRHQPFHRTHGGQARRACIRARSGCGTLDGRCERSTSGVHPHQAFRVRLTAHRDGQGNRPRHRHRPRSIGRLRSRPRGEGKGPQRSDLRRQAPARSQGPAPDP